MDVIELNIENLLSLTDKKLELLFEMPASETRQLLESLLLRGYTKLIPKFG